jgi:hypothetical protein
VLSLAAIKAWICTMLTAPRLSLTGHPVLQGEVDMVMEGLKTSLLACGNGLSPGGF